MAKRSANTPLVFVLMAGDGFEPPVSGQGSDWVGQSSTNDLKALYNVPKMTMLHKFRIQINKPPIEVFQFLCNKDTYKQQDGSPVLLLEKTTPGPVDVGTCYREVVQMAPFIKSQILSEITRYELYSAMEEKWVGSGMKGILTYFFHQVGQGTELIQHVSIDTHWLLRPFNTIISKTYSKAAQYRLEGIKMILESGQSPDIHKIKWWHFSKKDKRQY